ncbi:MAG: flagellar P-ring protein precursor FlgI [Nitrospirae bacterium]|nr:MAG: flagellar P-ring protein precursor FlgI [Nitrospirota bacterium]
MMFCHNEKNSYRSGIIFRLLLIAVVIISITPHYTSAERIKDISTFSGLRENELVGYGIIVGLNGTGDKDGTYIYQPFVNMLRRMGVSVNLADIKGKTKNIAAVMVTAKLQTNIKPGSRVDVMVSSIGDAKSLQGGTLIMTPLTGVDEQVYAVAQGPVSIGGFVAGGSGTTTIKNHPNVGTIPNGAIVEREVPVQLNNKEKLTLILTTQDTTTANRVAEKINEHFGKSAARVESPSAVGISVPPAYRDRALELMAAIEQLTVDVDVPARVIVNERTGTVVIGENVHISPVALAHGGLTIEIKTALQVSQPGPLAPAGAATVVVPQTDVKVEEKKAYLSEVKGPTIGELVKALNTLGVTPKDLVAILQAIKAAGSLKADLVVM